jgi:hypothetical protein
MIEFELPPYLPEPPPAAPPADADISLPFTPDTLARDTNIARVSDGEPTSTSSDDQIAQQQVPEPTPARGVAPPVEPPPNSSDLEKEFQEWEGRMVRLPDGRRIPDAYSRTGYLMSPFEDLSDVAAAGRKARSDALSRLGQACTTQ